MDESPTQPEGLILTKPKTPEQATEHFQIVRPPAFKTGVWKFINFFIRHKHHKHKDSDFLDEDQLRDDYGLCLLSDELGDQSSPFDRELLMENDKVEGETNSGEDVKVRSDARSFFHKMSLEGLMKLFADLHRKKRARELAKSSPSISEELTSAMAFDQPCCLERVERYMRHSSSVSVKKETTISRASSATVLETGYIRTTNMATPANSPQRIVKKHFNAQQNDGDGTLNLLKSVRIKLTDYLNAEESVNPLRAICNDSPPHYDMMEDDWSRRVATNMDNESLKYDTSCDDIPSLKNNSHQTLDEAQDVASKETVCSKRSMTKEDENLELNQSFLEETINSEIIPPLISSEQVDFENSSDIDRTDLLISTDMEEASTCKSYSYRDYENLEEKRLIQYQLLHVMPFTDQMRNPIQFLVSQDNNLPKMLSSHALDVAPKLDECSLVEINADESKEVPKTCPMNEKDYLNSIEKCDKGVEALNKNVQLCTTGVGSKVALEATEPKSNPNLDVFGEDLMLLEDSTPPLEAIRERKFEVVAVQRGSQDIMDEEEPYLISEKLYDTSIDEDFNQIANEDESIYVMENDEITKVDDSKRTELLFVCKYMVDVLDDNELATDEDAKEFEKFIKGNNHVSVDEESQTNEVIILEKDEAPQSSDERSDLEAMIHDQIANNFQFALEHRDLTMVTAEDQVRTSLEALATTQTISNPTVDDIKHTPTEESFMNNVHLSDSITSDLLSNLDLIILARKDDVGNTGSDSGIYISKNASRITTLTYKESQTIDQPIADKPVRIEGETAQEVEISNYVFERQMEGEKTYNEVSNDEAVIDDEKKFRDFKKDEVDTEQSSVRDESVIQNETETQTAQEKIVDVQRTQDDQIRDEKSEVGDKIKGVKALASDKPELAYAQAEEDIKMMIKELLFETEDMKETIIASEIHSQQSTSVDVCRGVLEDLVNNIPKEEISLEAEQEKSADPCSDVTDIMEAIIDKVCSSIDSKVHKNVVSVNYCLVHNHFHDKSAKKHDSRVVRANKSFRSFCKIKGNWCCSQSGPRVTVVNLSPTSQRFLRNEEKLTNRIRRSAALLMALYEEMRDYSYYSCTSNILCDLYESMSRNERYLKGRPDSFVAKANGNIFVNYQPKAESSLKTESANNEQVPETSKSKNDSGEWKEAPNTSSNNGESSSMMASSSFTKSLTISTSNSSIYSDSDEEMPLLEILPNLKYTYYSQEEINTEEELKQIENNIEDNAGRDLGMDVPLVDSASTDSIRTDVAINDSENFMKSEDDLRIA